MKTLVDVDHEGVEVDAAFGGYGGGEGTVEEVHEHCFAGSDVAVEIEACWGVRRC